MGSKEKKTAWIKYTYVCIPKDTMCNYLTRHT